MPKKVDVVRPVETIEIPDEFPDGFGHAGRRSTLSPGQQKYLQKSWDALADEDKARCVINLSQHVPQDVPHAPHRMAV